MGDGVSAGGISGTD